jgi:hypothetical protein
MFMNKVLMEKENEFTTEQLICIGEDLFHAVRNGGTRGAWQDKSDSVETIDLTEARRIALEWNDDPEEVDRILRSENPDPDK